MKYLTILFALSCLCFQSCRSVHWDYVSDNTEDGVLLARSEDEDGTKRSWRVYPGSHGAPRIEVTEATARTVQRIGVSVTAMTQDLAKRENAEPWKGVWVEHVQAGFPAARAGIVRGDIVLQVAGHDLTSAEQFADLVATHAKHGEELEITIRLSRRRGEPLNQNSSAPVKLVPEPVKVSDTNTDSIALTRSFGVQTYTGLQVATVPPHLARSIYNVSEPVILVTGVVTGSPAYYAGLRTGDRVLRCDGVATGSLDDVREAVLSRVRRDYPGAPLHDLDDSISDPSTASRDGDVQLEVLGPLGPHRATLETVDNIEGKSGFYIPIVVDYESNVSRTKLDFLEFIFQFGFDYEGRARPSATRQPIETSRWSFFPFGMFEFYNGVSHNSYRFLWLIEFETSKD